jgi:hypothetical protein
LAVGFHFFDEGTNKLHDPKPFTASFLRNAKGPFAPVFKSMLWDENGRVRLGEGALEETLEDWELYREQVADHYGFDESDRQQAAEVLKRHEAQLTSFFDQNREDIDTYLKNLERLEQQQSNPVTHDVPSLRDQREKLESELSKERAPWLAQIDRMWNSYEREMNSLANEDQRNQGELPLPRPGEKTFSAESIDKVIPYFNLIVGALLILGLFTRPTAIIGALFLCSVMATQWPWAYGAVPIHNQLIEALALLVLAATGAGRFAGLDFFIRCLWFWCCPPKTGK